MIHRLRVLIASALLVALPAVSHAALTTYIQSFETFNISGPSQYSLGGGWQAYTNIYKPDNTFVRGYGGAAPNTGFCFCAVDSGQGGVDQGQRQLAVYGDYCNQTDQTNGNQLEALVFQSQTIASGDIGARFHASGFATATAFMRDHSPATTARCVAGSCASAMRRAVSSIA